MNLFEIIAKGEIGGKREGAGRKAKESSERQVNKIPEKFEDRPGAHEHEGKFLLKDRANHVGKAMDNSQMKFPGENPAEHHSHGEKMGHTTHHFHFDADHVVIHAKNHPEGHVVFKPVITTHHGGKYGDESVTTHGEWHNDIHKHLDTLNSKHYAKFS